jgi:hypothetical protein
VPPPVPPLSIDYLPHYPEIAFLTTEKNSRLQQPSVFPTEVALPTDTTGKTGEFCFFWKGRSHQIQIPRAFPSYLFLLLYNDKLNPYLSPYQLLTNHTKYVVRFSPLTKTSRFQRVSPNSLHRLAKDPCTSTCIHLHCHILSWDRRRLDNASCTDAPIIRYSTLCNCVKQ